jgi:hypothetical protein
MRLKKIVPGALMVSLGILVILRLAITAHRDVVALNSPHDEYWYVLTAFNKIWGGAYDQMAFAHLPLYSMWIALTSAIGFPGRLAIDVFWIGVSGYLSLAIFGLTRNRAISGFLFLFLLFHPYAISIFDRALSENLLVACCALTLAGGIEVWNCRGSSYSLRKFFASLSYVVGFGVCYHIRKEGILFLFPVVIIAIYLVVKRRIFWSRGNINSCAGILVIFPVLSVLTIGSGLSAVNYVKWGVFARYDLATPGYTNAVAALNSIDVGPTPRHITVTHEALMAAYSHSRTFNELRPFLENGPGKMWLEISSAAMGFPGQIGNGWFYWALRDAAAHAGWHDSATQANEKYQAVADEINKEIERGGLKKRRYQISSFIDPDFNKWLPYLPASIKNIASLVVFPREEVAQKENASPVQFGHFSKMMGRRNPEAHYELAGWIIAAPGTLIGLDDGMGVLWWHRVGDNPRPDVPGAFAFTVQSVRQNLPLMLRVITPSGEGGQLAVGEISEGRVHALAGDINNLVGIDRIIHPNYDRATSGFVSKLYILYQYIGYIALVLVLICLLKLAFLRKNSGMDAVQAVLILVLAAAIARIFVFSLLDASSWSGMQARYMFPAVPFFGVIIALSIKHLFFACDGRVQIPPPIREWS